MSRPEIRRLRKFYEKHFPHGYLSKIKRLLQAPTAIVKRDESSGSGAGGSTGTLGNASSTPGNLNSSSGAINKNNSSPSKAPNNKHIIPADAISVNKKLGTGEFGIVQQGVWTNGTERIQVAIKCLCRERMQSNPMEFLKEAAIMHSIEHENIVRLYGVVLATDSLMLVTELAHLRSLFECLKDAGLRVSFLTVPTLCEFALQICNGMRYLENKRLIHRDLAARNILVFSKNKVKISDFGLSRALGVGKDYYKTNFNVNLKLPIAWCAPECINYLRFTNASDVWAYGVCLWEMFSYGFQPWAALTGLQILEAIDAPNYQRLEQPECCPREYYNLMMKCWQDDPSKRPKFNEIYEMLPEMKPEQLKAVDNCLESKTKDHLIYRQNDIITVLDRNTGTPFWKGVLNSGKTGLFNPSNTVAYVEGLPTLNRESFSRSTSDRASSKRKLRTEMISKPQNDFKHTGHVGIDGASFGDIAFLGSSQNYNHVPRQIVTPYKPSEDIEQTPLLLPPTPTSPDSLQTASGYFADDSQHSTSTMNPSFIPSTENTPKNFNNTNRQSNTFEFPTDHTNTNTNPFSMHKAGEDNANMTMALQNNNYGVENKEQLSWRQTLTAANRQSESFDEPHQYHEISDDDEMTPDKLDFGPSLLDEINSMFGSMTATTSTTLTTTITHNKNAEIDNSNTNTNTHNKRGDFSDLTSKLIRKNSAGATKKSKNSCGVVKPISVKDERILNQAIEIANEISARSMCSLVSDQPPPSTQSPKRKFSFRFPHLSNHPSSVEKTQTNIGLNTAGVGTASSTSHLHTLSPNSKKKNFTEELKSIPDLQEIIGEEGREAYKSLIERKPLLNATTAACLLGQLDPHIDRLNMTKTLPRRSMQRDEFCLSHGVNNFTTSPRFNGDIDRDLMIPPLQNAPRPTTLPTRGAANRARKVELGLLPSSPQRDSVDSSHSFTAAKTSDNISPCESPSYVTNTASFKLPDSMPADLNPLPVPPKEGKKHIQTNPKRHVRKYPLILPANGVQRTLNKVIGTENTNLCNMAVTVNMTPNLCIKKTSQIASPTSPSAPAAAAAAAADYENFKNNERNYQNVDHSTTDDSASLQFESILEADFNKDQVLHTPDVTDGFYNFSIQKEHYHKSKEVEYDPKKLTGLYVNEDELRNLDIDGNLEKLKVNATEHIRKIGIQNGMKMKTPPKQEEQIVEKLDEIKTQTTTTLKMPSPSSLKVTENSEENLDDEFKSRISPPVGNANPKRLFYVKTAKNELAGHALFQKVRESADKASAVQTSDNEAQRHSTQVLKTDITEGEFFTAAVNRLGASNSVSCEDLLEFADKKPKGRERGIDSDEVRIMVKVLGKDATPERCLASLEFINWDVHKAIKILKLQNILNTLNLTLAETVDHLQSCDWDLHTTARRLKIMKA
ncbi:activated Cdc42 kinase-like [Glossina fuscipes]|uniref:non-specific protein-tyrosine kinase n=1 Tax=Glossina fuscipes TaxID=7396 RepID=A0A9C6E3D3_9MUSC|nr:activated Cdc42 kinase-like isoform X2 [Glossina fuscipes]XP_037899269.1 activated Cdc42 kinase-like [Glossina fuscipes]